MKRIKYTPDAAEKLREIKKTISQKYGTELATKTVKTITDAIRGLAEYRI